MTTTEEPPDSTDHFDQDLDALAYPIEPDSVEPDSIYAPGNSGQVAGIVHGGMHLTIENRIQSLRRPLALGLEYVQEIDETFVDRTFQLHGGASTDSSGVLQLLRNRHCVVLTGEAGIGRRTSAAAILGRLGLPLQQLPGWDPQQPDQFDLSELPPEPARGYRLVLPDSGSPPDGLLHQLGSYRENLEIAGSYLIVVTTTATWAAATDGYLHDTAITVGAPDGSELLARRVGYRRRGIDLRAVLSDPAIDALARRASPRDTMRLADLVVAAADLPSNKPHTDELHAALVTSVIQAYQEWETDLSDWFRRHSSASDRLFLIAGAVLEGRPASLILQSAESLGTRLGGKPAESHGIAAAGIRELTHNIGATLEPDGGLSFPRPAYADAVIDFILRDRSDGFRRTLQRWMAQLPRSGRRAGDVAIADTVANVALGLALRHSDAAFVHPIVASWKGQPGLRPVLVDLLTAVALSDEAGSSMRNQLYHWSRQIEPDLVRVVTEVCAGELADAYPRIALTRINNVAQRATPTLIPDIVTAVSRLWGRPALRRDVLHRVLLWLANPNPSAFDVACQSLVVLGSHPGTTSDPLWLAFAHGGDSPLVSRAVGNVMNRDLPQGLRETLHGWFDTAAADKEFADWLIDVLAGAVPGPGSALRVSRMRVLADNWHGEGISPEQEALRERLIAELHRSDPMIQSWVAATAAEREMVHHAQQQAV